MRRRPDVLRRSVAFVALAVAAVAAIADSSGWVELVGLAAAVGLFVVWARWPALPTPVLATGVLLTVALAQRSGQLEPAMFLVALVAVIVAARGGSRAWVPVCLVLVVSPAVIVALQPSSNRMDWKIWVIGIAFSVVIGRGMYRQDRLRDQLEAARAELARQAQAEERRRIARDVHDLVGHGLAGVLLQVASARHVLRRDVDAADDALATAELVGRRSMTELRNTMTLLRNAEESAAAPPLPDLAQLGGLIKSARGDGLVVDYWASGELGAVSPAAGLALYRIAEEALHNAVRHAPHANTVVTVTVTDAAAQLKVESVGAPGTVADGRRPRYGLVGMRERAALVGGTLEAGPTPQGWRVAAWVPVTPQ
jgi:signal transduction histidine kinase